jgi:hypothetical protein
MNFKPLPTSSKWHFPSDLPAIILRIHHLCHECCILRLSSGLTCNDHNNLSGTVRHFVCVMTHETTSTLQFQITPNKMQRFYLFLQTLYMFQAVPPPIIRSTKLYIQLQVLSTNTAASMDGMVCSSISSTLAASSSIGWQHLKLYVQLCVPDDGRRNRLKDVERL